MRSIFYFFLFSLCIFSKVSADELMERHLTVQQGVFLFQTRNYAELERLSKAYDDNSSATIGGSSKSNLLDDGISQGMTISNENDIGRNDSIVRGWLKEYPRSPYAHAAFANSIFSKASYYRGGDWYGATSPEKIMRFNEGLIAYEKFIDETRSIWDGNIRWCIHKINAAKNKPINLSNVGALISECEEKFDSPARIYQMALNVYSPKWAGNAEILDEFIRSAMKNIEIKQGHKEGLIAYASMYEYFAGFHGGYYFSSRLFRETKANWALMRDGLRLEAEKYPGAWKLNKYAAMACIANDKTSFDEAMANKLFYVVPPLWRYVDIDQCKSKFR